MTGAHQFELLSRIAGLVDSAPEFERIAPTIARTTAELLGADGLWVCIRRRNHQDIVRRHAFGIVPRSASAGDFPIGADPLVELAIVAGRDVWISDYPNADLSDPLLRDQQVNSVVMAPIAAGGRDLGALVAFRTDPAPRLRSADGALIAQAAQTLALVLTTHRAQREHARALARERSLARATLATAAAGSLTEALQRTADGAAAVADAVFAGILLADDHGSRLVAASAGSIRDALVRGADGGLRGHGLRRLGEIAAAGSLEAGRPLLYVDAIGLFERFGFASSPRDVRGRLCVLEPIVEAGVVYGAMLVLLDAAAPDPEVFGSLETLAAHAAGVIRRERLHRDVEGAYLSTVTALANALEAKDAPTHEHASETARVAVAVGRRLGLGDDALRDLEFAAVLHDVGKIAIPDDILNRRGPLTADEWAFVRDHTVIGERILRGIPFLQSAAAAVRSAHERWDGGGYPDGLAGEEIPVLSRIVFACDTWDVMTSDRPYRRALPRSEALRRLEQASGTQLDPAVVAALGAVIGERAVEMAPRSNAAA